MLFDFYPQHEKEMRQKLLGSLSKKEAIFSHRFTEEDITFKINKVSEKGFIILLAQSLFQIASLKTYNKGIYVRRVINNFDEKMINDFGLNNNYLIDTAKDENEDILFRAACLTCYMSQYFLDKKIARNSFFENGIGDVFLSLMSENTKDILTNALFVFCYEMQTYDEALMEFLGCFSILIKDDFFCRAKIQNVYLRLRERSFAPVSSRKCLRNWLSYSY